MKNLLLATLMFFSIQIFSQKNYYPEGVQNCISEKNKLAAEFSEKGDQEKSRQMIKARKNCPKGLFLENYAFESIKNEIIEIKNIEKPILLKITESWCKPCMAEIPAINKIAEDYKDKIQIIVLYWDEKEKVEKTKDKYASNIEIIPSIETSKRGKPMEIAGFKHYLGYPTSYYIESSKKIASISRNVRVAGFLLGKGMTNEEVNKINYDNIKKNIEVVLNSEKKNE